MWQPYLPCPLCHEQMRIDSGYCMSCACGCKLRPPAHARTGKGAAVRWMVSKAAGGSQTGVALTTYLVVGQSTDLVDGTVECTQPELEIGLLEMDVPEEMVRALHESGVRHVLPLCEALSVAYGFPELGIIW